MIIISIFEQQGTSQNKKQAEGAQPQGRVIGRRAVAACRRHQPRTSLAISRRLSVLGKSSISNGLLSYVGKLSVLCLLFYYWNAAEMKSTGSAYMSLEAFSKPGGGRRGMHSSATAKHGEVSLKLSFRGLAQLIAASFPWKKVSHDPTSDSWLS